MEKQKYNIYDVVVLSENKSCDMYTFYAGQSVKIIDIDSNGYSIADGLGRVISNCGWNL